MRPHPRIRKTIKWGGLVVAALILAIIAYSASCVWSRYWIGPTRTRNAGISQGMLWYRDSRTLPDPRVGPPSSGWATWETNPPRLRWWQPEWEPPGAIVVELPLWMPALASLLASALAWRLDTLATRRAKLGACPTCSYSRTGLAPSSPCPECGSAAPRA